MSDIEQARLLLRLAHRDFNALRGMADSPLVVDEIFGFHAQQSVEKALKAWLCAKEMIYPLTHELPRLLSLLENMGATVEPYWPLMRFTPYAVQARYEEGPAYESAHLDRNAIIAEVRTLLEQVEAIVETSGMAGEIP